MTFDFGSVKKQKVDFVQINKILQKAFRSIQTAEMAFSDNDPEGALTMAYEAMLKTSLALLSANGFRPRIQLGHHKTLILYARHILVESASVIDTYDRLRRKRNKTIYDVEVVTKLEAKQSVAVAKMYFILVEEKIESQNPQQKLWRPK